MPESPLDAAVAYFENQYVNQFYGHEVAARLRALAAEEPVPADRAATLTEENTRLRGTLDRVRALQDELGQYDEFASPEDEITRGVAAERIAHALDGLAADNTTQEPPR
ncbi:MULTISPECIES: hypothetical protein [Streptomyces]|uniref:hypothetical protein n=1 Tax=Streptomyces TaxID=1883 RepID=UPI0005BB26BB|nr:MULTISPECIES: hypothetical protein [Streptomyces]MDP9953150.1 hypothetical protein [Streptomyces sp. DSM 41269]